VGNVLDIVKDKAGAFHGMEIRPVLEMKGSTIGHKHKEHNIHGLVLD